MAVNQDWTLAVDELRRRLGYWLRQDPARLLWPRQCLACGEPGQEGLDLCPACAASWPGNACACPGCALPLPLPGVCGRCTRQRAASTRRPPLDGVHAACLYRAPADRLLLRFKFHRDLAAGALLAQLMSQALAAAPRPAALVPLPLHRDRLRRRGFDQALELARPLARALELPLLDDRLVRLRATGPQSDLGRAERRRNVRGAFAVRDGPSLPAHVVLVDDVMTTGATLAEAARALRRAGVARVEAWVCARTA